MAIIPLRDDPLGVRLVVGFRVGRGLGEEGDAVFRDLRAAYEEIAWSSSAYARWLRDQSHPSLPVVA
jgi:hypothetical protein